MKLHHVQVAIPPGGEPVARLFYADGLGMVEADKPEPLRGRGGLWFRWYDDSGEVTAEIHAGVEAAYHPGRKAHPALLLDSIAELDATAQRLADRGFAVDLVERRTFPGYERVHAFDGHGNRVELLARQDLTSRAPGPAVSGPRT